jgi:opacity protein-like surface antigen
MRLFTCALSFVLAGVAAGPIYAQTARPERPQRSLFGGGYGNAEQMLTLSANFGGGYDSSVLSVDPDSTQGQPAPSKTSADTFNNASASLAYQLSKTGVSFGATAYTSVGYYPSVDRPFFGGTGGGVNGGFTISSRMSANVGATVSHQPLYALLLPTLPGSFNQAPGEIAPLDPSLTARANNHMSFQTNVGLSYLVTKHGTLTGSYGRSLSNASIANFSRGLSTQTISGNFSQGLAKGLVLNLGYGFSDANYGGVTGQANAHNINVGLNYNKALSISRRTALSFTTGSMGVSDRGSIHWVVTGNVQLTREVGRTWNAAVGYSRNVSFIEGFTAPVLSDSAFASYGGMINRKLQFTSGVGMSLGAVGFGLSNNNFSSYFGSAGLRVGLTQSIAVSLNYTYSRYTFESGVALLPGLVSHTNRQSVMVSLNLWEPLFHRARR